MTKTRQIEDIEPGTVVRIGKNGQALLVSVDTTYAGKTYYTIRRYIASRETYAQTTSTYACQPGREFEVVA